MEDFLLIIDAWHESDYPVIFVENEWWVVDGDGEQIHPVTLH